jgi:hypothetical protein
MQVFASSEREVQGKCGAIRSEESAVGDDKSNQRASPRKAAAIDLSRHLVMAGDRRPVRGLAVDISRNGLGIVCFEDLPLQSDVILALKDKGISLKVMWCKADSVRQGIFHAGLGTNDLAISIPKLLGEEGLIPESSVVQKTPQEDRSRVIGLTFETLRDALATAHTSDSGAFRNGPLAKLASTFNAFPINHQGASFYVLLPKDLKPNEASKLLDAAAADRKIFILKSEGGTWRKIWPSKDA